MDYHLLNLPLTPAEMRKMNEAYEPVKANKPEFDMARHLKKKNMAEGAAGGAGYPGEVSYSCYAGGAGFKVVKVTAAEAKKEIKEGKAIMMAAAKPEMTDMQFLNKFANVEFKADIAPSVRTKFLAVCRQAIEVAEVDENAVLTSEQEKNITFRSAKRGKCDEE
jgi:hypothetical protein